MKSRKRKLDLSDIIFTYCDVCEKQHCESHRQYAHVFHYPSSVCLSRAIQSLPSQHYYALLAHEIGHLLAGAGASEKAANVSARRFFNIKRIEYIDSEYGNSLEHVSFTDALKIRNILKLYVPLMIR